MVKKKGWIPPLSPHGLIQESLWPDEWAILVSCIMLNCTTRKQVEKILPGFLKRWPTPGDLLTAEKEDIVTTISPLGFGKRRADNLISMSREFLKGTWEHARDLPGIGRYGAAAWEIFCCGFIGNDAPVDHALVKYWDWAKGISK